VSARPDTDLKTAERVTAGDKRKMLMEYPDIIYTKENHIATITMNRPDKMNAFTPEMSDSLYRAFKDSD